jgi:hypothetical protein
MWNDPWKSKKVSNVFEPIEIEKVWSVFIEISILITGRSVFKRNSFEKLIFQSFHVSLVSDEALRVWLTWLGSLQSGRGEKSHFLGIPLNSDLSPSPYCDGMWKHSHTLGNVFWVNSAMKFHFLARNKEVFAIWFDSSIFLIGIAWEKSQIIGQPMPSPSMHCLLDHREWIWEKQSIDRSGISECFCSSKIRIQQFQSWFSRFNLPTFQEIFDNQIWISRKPMIFHSTRNARYEGKYILLSHPIY